jgi:hypothetical protein
MHNTCILIHVYLCARSQLAQAGLQVGDAIEVFFQDGAEEHTPAGAMSAAIAEHIAMIRESTGSTPLPMPLLPAHAVLLASDTFSLDDGESQAGSDAPTNGLSTVTISITRPALSFAPSLAAKAAAAGVSGSVVSTLLASMSYATLAAAADVKDTRDSSSRDSSGSSTGAAFVPLVVDGARLVAVRGEDYFLSALSMVQASKPAELQWAL